MRIDELTIEAEPLAGAIAAYRATADVAGWRATCAQAREQEGRLVALWASDRMHDGFTGARFAMHAVLAVRPGLIWITLPLAGDTYPDVSDLFPAAARMQRAAFDMVGARAVPAGDTRPWLRHAAWPADQYPLRKDFDARSAQGSINLPDAYAFVRVEGDGVHEIPVGPVHAGTIEPGHFRFSVLGERVLRLEERLGYTHKGIEKRFEQLTLAEGAKLAGRISGDSTVAYSWAYAMAIESALVLPPPPRAAWLRALLLERERIANHLGDLGFLGNDAGFAFGLSQFSRLKEDVLRLNADLFGHRYLMDMIVPGGVARDLDDAGAVRIAAQSASLADAIAGLREIYEDHPGLQDRFTATGIVTPELAARLDLCGLAGRASGIAYDARDAHAPFPYSELGVKTITRREGDVAARVLVRFDELLESLRLSAAILEHIDDGPVAVALPESIAAPSPGTANGGCGVGFIESWRGPVLIALETCAPDGLHRVHAHDPSWQNWPVIEHAVIGNIVPDFPLINKSFNLSYSGHDL